MNTAFRVGPDHRAGPLKKSDLQYRYPQGAVAGDDPTKRAEPDRSLINRTEWYEILYFVNKFANECGKGDRNVALKAERLLQEKVPSNQRSHQHVQDWLLANWKLYPAV